MSASSRVCPQERAVWRFDARGGYPWGWSKSGRIWARFGATFLSLEIAHRVIKMSTRSGHDQSDILSLWLDQDLKMRSWFSGVVIGRDQRLKMRRWKGALCLKSSPHNEDLIHIKGKDQTLKMRFWFSAVQDSQGSRPQNEALKKDACPHFEGMKFGRSFFGTAFYIRKNKLVLCFFDVPWGEVRARSQAQKSIKKKGKNKWTIIKILPS